jgi:GNAT superfamily N-acetyltransferase
MSPPDDSLGSVRRARQEDVEPILDLLTHYDLPRSAFEPFYYGDPEYRPEHSWVVEQEGELVAHLRIYDRWIWVAGQPLHIAGVGNVITAQQHRGRGYASLLLDGVLDQIVTEDFGYSLLWTHLPAVYARHGWVPIGQEIVEGTISGPVDGYVDIRPFVDADLPDVMRLYDETNVERTGPTVRSEVYWRAHMAWVQEDRSAFLVARSPSGQLAGYIRSGTGGELLELGTYADQPEVSRNLLKAVQERRGEAIRGPLPPSLRGMFGPGESTVVDRPGLMGRTLNLGALVRSLGPLWTQRLRDHGHGSFGLSTSTDAVEVTVTPREVIVETLEGAGAALGEREFAELLFHGAPALAQNGPQPELLQTLFPPQDFVIWQTENF